MIDSVVFRVHNLEQHERLIDLLHKKNIEGQSQSVKVIDSGEFVENFTKQIQFHNIFTDHVKGTIIEKSYRNHLPSHHYDIAYAIYFTQDYIEFNMSIPKYLYGTNVFQFVPHVFDRDYEFYFTCSDFQEVCDLSYLRLKRFLRYFIERDLGKDLVNEYFVQICQIDICYNKLFNNSEDAFLYLSDLKRIKKTYLRDTSNGKSIYHTGIHFHTSDYALKIYHKGAEFKLHDRKQLKKRGKWPLGLINEVQKIADRTLRFEVSFRNGMMNRLFKDFIFRKEDSQYQLARKYFNQIRSNKYIVDTNGNRVDQLGMSRNQKALVKYGRFIDNRTFHFDLASDSAFYRYFDDQDKEIKAGEKHFTFERDQRFSKLLFRHMFTKYLSFFNEFKVTYEGQLIDLINVCQKNATSDSERMANLLTHAQFQNKIPEDVKGHLRWRAVLYIVDLLKTRSWEDIKSSNLLSKTQYFRVRRLFKALGITNPATIMVQTGDNNFRDYYDAVGEIQSAYNVQRFLQPVPF